MSTIGSETRLRLPLVAQLLLLAFAFGGLWFKLDAVQRDVRRQWTFTHQTLWAERLATRNPNLQVPDVQDVVRAVNAQN